MLIRDNFLFDAEGKGGGGEGGEGGGDKIPTATTFSAEYVKELRQENATWRTKAQTHATEAATAKTAAEAAIAKAAADIEDAKKKVTTEAAEKVTATEVAANARVIRSELKAAAAKLGLVDMDALKMLDQSALKVNDAGDVEGIDALLDATKKAKPYLFGEPSTSSSQTPPDKKKGDAKKASDMTDAEFDSAVRNHAWRS